MGIVQNHLVDDQFGDQKLPFIFCWGLSEYILGEYRS